jgi:hypothetical protein
MKYPVAQELNDTSMTVTPPTYYDVKVSSETGCRSW